MAWNVVLVNRRGNDGHCDRATPMMRLGKSNLAGVRRVQGCFVAGDASELVKHACGDEVDGFATFEVINGAVQIFVLDAADQVGSEPVLRANAG